VTIRITHLDHLVLTVADPAATADFYTRVLGMELRTFGAGRIALHFGDSKINIHEAGREIVPHAHAPTPGSEDICLITQVSSADVVAHLAAHGVEVEEGPVTRTGATGPITSCYVRDPDGNLVEIATKGE
jgi:catechol 2,3-dioxygenase-like lactoylglutathione lyase family enzyme